MDGINYTLRDPIGPGLDREGRVISRHHTLAGAIRSLHRRQAGAFLQGGFSLAYVWDERRAERCQDQ